MRRSPLRMKGVHMVTHKFKVGQNVRFRPMRSSTMVGAQECKILRLLPIENGVRLYRIKCVAENVERVANEGELRAAPLA
jgi:hypothetical protein